MKLMMVMMVPTPVRVNLPTWLLIGRRECEKW